MAEVVLFHHALGLSQAVIALAEDLRAAGRLVHRPDLFAGRTFVTLDQGVQHAQEVGFGEIIQRGARAVGGLASGLVYVCLSLGVLPRSTWLRRAPGAGCDLSPRLLAAFGIRFSPAERSARVDPCNGRRPVLRWRG
jgi:hypothetical protein